MAKKHRGGGHGGGGHGWFVTFADLMGLLVSFFVMLVAFSSQDQAKLQLVAGSMREAFGVQPYVRYSGIIEVDGLPTRPRLKNVQRISPNESSSTPSPDDKSRNFDRGSQLDNMGAFALASASLRQALNEMPELAEVSKHIMIEETRQGLNIEIVDQDGRSMFPSGLAEPYERTRKLIDEVAKILIKLPNRVSVSGHTDANPVAGRAGYSNWELTSDRANATRRILENAGLSNDRIYQVVGKADSEPLFPEDPYMAANRRLSIVLLREAPVTPPGFSP